jgi:hypothetical protein
VKSHTLVCLPLKWQSVSQTVNPLLQLRKSPIHDDDIKFVGTLVLEYANKKLAEEFPTLTSLMRSCMQRSPDARPTWKEVCAKINEATKDL